MALQINTTLEGGIIAPECYARIIQITYVYPTVGIPGARVLVGFYFNEAARETNQAKFVESRKYIAPVETTDTREGYYTFLKTLPDFAGAIDV